MIISHRIDSNLVTMRLKSTIKKLFSMSLGVMLMFVLWIILNPPSKKDIGLITDAAQCYQNKKVCKTEAKVFQEELRKELNQLL